MTAESIFWAVLPSLIVSVVMLYFNRSRENRDKVIEERARARKEESLLQLELQMATAKLSYAVAMAMKRGKVNGEVEQGVTAYEQAESKYREFLRVQANEHLQH